MMIINIRNFIDYSLLLLVIAVSGIPYFSTSFLLVPIFLILLIVFIKRKLIIDKLFIYLILGLTIVTIVQTYQFSFFSFETIFGVYTRILIAYMTVKILEKRFIEYYINILYFFAFSSLILFPIFFLLPSFSSISSIFDIFNLSNSVHKTIIILNLSHLERNSGPFWEPGAFAGYLTISLIFLYFSKVRNKIKKEVIILVAIITTFSTTAYVALFSFYFFIYFVKIKNIFFKSFVIVFILSSAYYSYHTFDFLGEKISKQIESANVINPYLDTSNTQRFLNILRDKKDFEGYELFGRGTNSQTRYSYLLEEQIRTVGLTDILVKFGSLFFILINFFMLKSLIQLSSQNFNKNFFIILGSYLSINITLLSEVYFNFPFYWALLFLFTIYSKEENDLHSNTSI